MTVQEIEDYLKRQGFLIFKYQSEYYSLMKNRTLFGARYSLIASDALYQRGTIAPGKPMRLSGIVP